MSTLLRPLAAALLFALLGGCATGHIRGLGLDHVILGAPNLADGSAEFEQLTGVKPTYGGRHLDRGTENALVALDNGASYIEIIAPAAGATPTGDLAGLAQLKKLTPIGWALHVDDINEARSVVRRAGFAPTPPQPGSRVTPDMFKLQWTTFGIAKPRVDTAPFFIRWSDPLDHPSWKAPRGCGLREIRIEDPNEPALVRLLAKLGVAGIRTRAAATPAIYFQLVCRKGEVLFPSE